MSFILTLRSNIHRLVLPCTFFHKIYSKNIQFDEHQKKSDNFEYVSLINIFPTIMLIWIPMRNQHDKDRCCCRNGIKQGMIIFLILAFFVDFYAIQEAILTSGQLNNNITNLNSQNLSMMNCLDICGLTVGQPLDQLHCCQNNSSMLNCKEKQVCRLQMINKYQSNLNRQYESLYGYLAIDLVILLIFIGYCIKKRFQQARKRTQIHIDREQNSQAAVINIVGNYFIRREIEPAHLQESFLYGEQDQSCTICLEPLLEQKVINLNCNHLFHSTCIKSWMETHNTCPVCRTEN